MTDKQLAVLIRALFVALNQLVYAVWFVAFRYKSDALPDDIRGFGLELDPGSFLLRYLPPQSAQQQPPQPSPPSSEYERAAARAVRPKNYAENPQAWNGPKTWGQLMELGYKADVSRPDSWGNCNKCGMRVFWVITPKGKRMPLEAVSSTEFDVHFAKCPRK